jgi:hypothetical protein
MRTRGQAEVEVEQPWWSSALAVCGMVPVVMVVGPGYVRWANRTMCGKFDVALMLV